MLVWQLASVRYAVSDSELLLKQPFRRREIPLGDILEVSRVTYRHTWRDPMPEDFALGTNVLKISVQGTTPAIVSPRNEAGFLAAIGKDVPGPVAPL